MGLTRNCVVTVFSQVDSSEVVSFVFEEVAPLAAESR
jgi:predicted nuclease of restriction endonuclease-like RecB superfamily